jgi:hypothetical protein
VHEHVDGLAAGPRDEPGDVAVVGEVRCLDPDGRIGRGERLEGGAAAADGEDARTLGRERARDRVADPLVAPVTRAR